jgi:CubicO group peptidase (beta-lactamase class C family)
MHNKLLLSVLFICLFFTACDKSDPPANNTPVPLYFPPVTGTTWNTISTDSLGWSSLALDSLYDYLELKNSKAFIILKNGRIAIEKYFGSFTRDSIWYWASAGKTMTAMLVGIAQQEGLLNINDKTSDYLGVGWTSLPAPKEDLITIHHQLTMTTGLNDDVPDDDCTLPSCLTYLADAGTRWAYHNAPYTMLDSVLISATGVSYNTYFQQKIRNRIGMNGLWVRTGYNNVFFSNARSMARFGLLMLNKGKWNQDAILTDTAYFNQQVNTSQNLNLSYGYLTWLNGKSSHMLPTVQNIFSGYMIPNGPVDMYAALGKNDQKIYVVPSQNLVVIRMGEAAGNVQLALSSFDNELWGKLKRILGY